jgi:hypothetical protein
MDTNSSFWDYLDKLLKESEIIIEKPRGSKHKSMENIVYVVGGAR